MSLEEILGMKQESKPYKREKEKLGKKITKEKKIKSIILESVDNEVFFSNQLTCTHMIMHIR